jgi:hypothetical protein
LVERRTVNPQVPGSSPGRGATEFVTDLGLSPASPTGLLFLWDRYTESPRVGIGSFEATLFPRRKLAWHSRLMHCP